MVTLGSEESLFSLWPIVAFLVLLAVIHFRGRKRHLDRQDPGNPLTGDRPPYEREALEWIARARAGEALADTAVLRTSARLRLAAVLMGAALLALVWSPTSVPQGILPSGPGLVLAVTAAVIAALADILTFQVVQDRQGITVTRLGLWTRRREWRHLMAIRDDGGYVYVLDFGTRGPLRIYRNLTGMPGLLDRVADALEVPKTHARTARG